MIVEERAHSSLGPSSSARWMACPGSVSLSKGKESTSSFFAAEGTAAHELGETCLVQKKDAEAFIDTVIKVEASDFPVTEEMADAVQTYLDFVRQIKGELMVETTVDLSEWVPGSFGHCDVAVLDRKAKHLHVVDFKYGMGVRVAAEDNPQGKMYALGALDAYEHEADWQTLSISIVQPRIGNIDTWETTVDELLAWADDELAPAAKRALAKTHGPEDFNPGEKQCQFCLAKGTCKALADFAIETAMEGFDDEPKDVLELSVEDIAAHYLKVPLVQTWCKALAEEATRRALDGVELEGLKLVEGRSVRKLALEDEEVIDWMNAMGVERDDMTVIKLKPLTQLEKLLRPADRKDFNTDLVVKPAGAPTLVAASDKRPAIVVDPTDGFEEN